MGRLKKTMGGGIVLALATVGLVITAQAASAHTTAISGVAACQSDGTYKITWTGHTDQVPAGDIATVTEKTPDNKVITSSLAPNADYTYTTTAPGSASSQSTTVHVDWIPNPARSREQASDTFSADASGSITLAGTCTQHVTVPGAPVPTTPSCSTDGSVAIPANTISVKWLVGGSQVNAGAGGNEGPGTYVVSAHTTFGYSFTDGTTSVTYNVTVLPKVTGLPCYIVVSPVAPTVHPLVCDSSTGQYTGGSFDLAADTAGIHYAKAGLSAVATLQAGYKFPTTLPAGWALNRDGTASYKVTYPVTDQRCLILAHPSIPILSLPQCSEFPGYQADYTITSPITVGVIYYLYGHTFTTTQVPLGTVVTVTATPATGYFFTAASLPQGFQLQENGSATISWNTDALRIDCDVVVTPVTPTLDQNHCDTTTGLITFGQPILPANTPGITYSVKGYVVTADLSDGYVFSDDISANWVVDEDGGSAAYTLVPFTSGTCVKVVVVNPPPAPPVTPAVSSPPLAFTGAGNNIVMGGIAAFLVLGGMALLFVGRRRKA